MMKKYWLYTLLFPALTWAADLTLEISEIRKKPGKLLIAIYNQAEPFESNAFTQAVHFAELEWMPHITHTVSGLKPGDYAVALLHDENGNRTMDTAFLGRPKEGYGFSNNVGRFSKPSFKKSTFTLPVNGAVLSLKMRYLK